jgi:hypothetical protein
MKHAPLGGPNNGDVGWKAGGGARGDGGGRSSVGWEAGGNTAGSQQLQIQAPPRLWLPDLGSSSPATTESGRKQMERRRA